MMRIVKKVYGFFLTVLTKTAGMDTAKKTDAWIRFGRHLNLKRPETLADKVSYLELHQQSKLASDCTDKWKVRQYVADKGLEKILIPVYGTAYASSEEIDFEQLPDQFVIKATHGCKMNLICANKQKLDRRKAEKILKGWLTTTYGTYSVEPHYYSISHRIYIEKYLGDNEKIRDYKFYCCHGKISFIEVCSNRTKGLLLNLFDTDWNELDGVQGKCKNNNTIPRPEYLEEMKGIAETLAEDFVFVRVDLYLIKDQIYFGELTFTPSNGVFPNFTDQFIRTEGQKLVLSE